MGTKRRYENVRSSFDTFNSEGLGRHGYIFVRFFFYFYSDLKNVYVTREHQRGEFSLFFRRRPLGQKRAKRRERRTLKENT